MRKMSLFDDVGKAPSIILHSEDYLIKNKDEVLGVFRWTDLGDVTVVRDFGLPEFIIRDVDGWLESRTPPKHREHVEELLKSCGLRTKKDILDFAKGLTLTDTLWVTSDEALQWQFVNLFDNEFDDTIAHIAFDGELHSVQFSTTSPEFGTDGMLAKCWVRDSNGLVYLIKAGTEGLSNTGKEPLSEVLAHQVLTRLCYSHVTYKLSEYRGRRVSICDLMTSQKVMLLPIYKYYNFTSMTKVIKDCVADGMDNGIAQMMVFDYLSWNTDRHTGNFGVLLDADTFALIGFAPIWDNGCSMFCYYNGTDDLDEYISRSGLHCMNLLNGVLSMESFFLAISIMSSVLLILSLTCQLLETFQRSIS